MEAATPVQTVSRPVMSLSSLVPTWPNSQSVSPAQLIVKLPARSHRLHSRSKASIKLKLTCTSRPKHLTCRAPQSFTLAKAWQIMQSTRSRLVQAHLAGTKTRQVEHLSNNSTTLSFLQRVIGARKRTRTTTWS